MFVSRLLIAGYISTLAVILKTTNTKPWVNEFECKAKPFSLQRSLAADSNVKHTIWSAHKIFRFVFPCSNRAILHDRVNHHF